MTHKSSFKVYKDNQEGIRIYKQRKVKAGIRKREKIVKSEHILWMIFFGKLHDKGPMIYRKLLEQRPVIEGMPSIADIAG